jgi:hypothetical protein
LKKRLAKREVGPCKRGRKPDHLLQLFDLLRRAATGTGAVRDCEIELRFDGRRRERDRFLELADGFLGVRGREGGAEVAMRICVVGRQAHGLAQSRDAT